MCTYFSFKVHFHILFRRPPPVPVDQTRLPPRPLPPRGRPPGLALPRILPARHPLALPPEGAEGARGEIPVGQEVGAEVRASLAAPPPPGGDRGVHADSVAA